MTQAIETLRDRLQRHPMGVGLYALLGAALYIRNQPKAAVLSLIHI